MGSTTSVVVAFFEVGLILGDAVASHAAGEDVSKRFEGFGSEGFFADVEGVADNYGKNENENAGEDVGGFALAGFMSTLVLTVGFFDDEGFFGKFEGIRIFLLLQG